MKKEKTAVQWLIDEIENIPFQCPEVTDYYNDVIALFDQAKQMEKEQIKSAFLDGYGNGHSNGVMYDIDEDLYESKISDPKHYYESKYGKDENKAENND